MKRVKLIATACATAMLAVLTLNAQDFNTNERTFLTFSNTVELPGVTLQPGTYLFKLADSQSSRHIVQVLSQDEKQVHATILAVPAERLEVTGENVVTFRENAEGTTPAVQYWYYPGDRIGHEFVYPKAQAMKIAARTGQNVLSTEGEVSSSDSRVSSMSPTGQETEWNREGAASPSTANPQATVQGTAGVSEMPSSQQEQQTAQAQPESTQPSAQTQPESTQPPAQAQSNETMNPQSETPDRQHAETTPAESAQSAQSTQSAQTDARGHSGVRPESQDRAVGTSGQANDTAAASRGNELPRTASPLPLSGLIGLLSLGGAFGLRRARK
jgi:hypothetical protein